MTDDRNAATVRAYFSCLDAEDWVGMRRLWQSDGDLRAVGARPRTGIDEVIAYFAGIFSPWPRHEDRPTRLIDAGDTIVAEVTFSGTTQDGREVTFDAVDVIDLRDGLIASLTNWYDIAYARKLSAPRSDAGTP